MAVAVQDEITKTNALSAQPTSIADLGYTNSDAGEQAGFSSLVSSSKARDEIENRQGQLQQISTTLQSAKEQALAIQANIQKLGEKEAAQKKTDEERRQQATTEAAAVGITPETVSPEEQRLVDYNETIDRELQNYTTQLDIMGTRMNETLQTQIRAIQQRYQQRRNEMVDLNKRSLGSLTTVTQRLGGKFVAGITSGILSSEESAGIGRLADLDSEESQLIAEAQNAYDTKNFELFTQKMAATESARDKKLKVVGELNRLAAEKNNEITKEHEALKRTVAVSDFVSSAILGGETDINSIYSRARESGIDISPKELSEAYTFLTGEQKKTTPEDISADFRDYNYLASLPNRGGLPENITNPIQYVQYRNQLDTDMNAKNTTPSANGVTRAESPYGTPEMGTISSLEDIDKLPVSNLTKSVMAGYIKAKELTPTDRAKVAEELYQVGFNPNQYITRKLEGLIALYSAIPEEYKGVVEGFIYPSLVVGHTEPTIGTFESAVNVMTRELARLNDVGVLSDQDVASYSAAMPSRMDNDIVQVIAKLSGLQLATGGKVSEDAGKTGTLRDGRDFIVGLDGETLLDPKTGKAL